MSEEIKVSEEARECAAKEINEHNSFLDAPHIKPVKTMGYHVQLLLNQQIQLACLNWRHRDAALQTKIAALEAEAGELKNELSKTEFGDKHSYDQRYHCFSCLSLKPVHHEKCNFTKLMHDHNTALNSTKGEK